jgi:HEAT repeat protein
VREIAAALDTLRSGDFQVRWDAAKQLENCGDEVVAPLLALLKESEFDAELQWFIAQILGSLEHPEVILALGQLLERSEDEEVRLKAAQSLAGLGGSAFAQLSTCLKDPHRQMMAVRALTQIDRPEVVPLLLEAAQTGTAEVRSIAFEALDPFVDPRILGVLWDGLTDPSPEVRKAAIAALATRTQDCPAEDLVQQLIPYLEDADLTVAAQAARSLGRLATEGGAIALARKGCESTLDPTLQETIIQALGWIGSLTAIDGLMKIWQALAQQVPLPERRMQNVLTSFAGITGAGERSRAVEQVMELVRSPVLQQVKTLRAQAVLSLGRLADAAMLQCLVNLLEDPDYVVQLHVVAALKQIDAALAYEIIRQRRSETDITDELGKGLAIALQEW